MSDTPASLRHKIASAGELESVVRTMKAMAASCIGQYENAVRSLDDYDRTVQLGLVACFGHHVAPGDVRRDVRRGDAVTGAVVFGSDQGLVGAFNDAMAAFVADALRALPGRKVVWAVGERVRSRLDDAGFTPDAVFGVPHSINAVTPLVGRILEEVETLRERGGLDEVYLFHHRPDGASGHAPMRQRLLPLDAQWRHDLSVRRWPTQALPQVLNARAGTLRAFVREYLFVSLFRACAESLASENASRLSAMQRAEKNIGDLLDELGQVFHRQRQRGIDEELFDVVSGFEALNPASGG